MSYPDKLSVLVLAPRASPALVRAVKDFSPLSKPVVEESIIWLLSGHTHERTAQGQVIINKDAHMRPANFIQDKKEEEHWNRVSIRRTKDGKPTAKKTKPCAPVWAHSTQETGWGIWARLRP